MKKIIAIMLALVLVISMAIPVAAVPPKMQIPDLPEIPDVSGNVNVELPQTFWDRWFAGHPIKFDFNYFKSGG